MLIYQKTRHLIGARPRPAIVPVFPFRALGLGALPAPPHRHEAPPRFAAASPGPSRARQRGAAAVSGRATPTLLFPPDAAAPRREVPPSMERITHLITGGGSHSDASWSFAFIWEGHDGRWVRGDGPMRGVRTPVRRAPASRRRISAPGGGGHGGGCSGGGCVFQRQRRRMRR